MNKPETIDAYIAGCRPKVQPILREILEVVRAAAPDAKEVISYGMPTFRMKRIIVHIGAFKNHIGLFPPVREPQFADRIVPYRNEKANLSFPLSQPMPLDLIRDIVKARVAGMY